MSHIDTVEEENEILLDEEDFIEYKVSYSTQIAMTINISHTSQDAIYLESLNSDRMFSVV